MRNRARAARVRGAGDRERFGIRGIPTLIAFEKGKVPTQHAGLVGLNFLRALARTA
jgi:hypothetical protein